MKNMHCKLFGHNYRITRHVTHHVKEYTCKNCKKELTINANGKLIELTPKHKEINDVLERIYSNRTLKNNIKTEAQSSKTKVKTVVA